MTIEMRKIGRVLNSRPAGREAFLAIQPLRKNTEPLTLDFAGVMVLTPSFADEFVTPLVELYKGRLSFLHTGNITVRKTLAFLSADWPKEAYKWEERTAA